MSDAITEIAVQYFLPASLAMITLAMGLGLVTNDFKALLQKPKAALVGVCGQTILLPLLAFLIAWGFALPPAFAVGIVLVASCPGGAHSNLFTNLAKGDVALSVSLTAISGVICMASIPFYVYLSTLVFANGGEFVSLPVADTILQLLAIVIIPLAIGMMIRYKLPRFAHYAEKVVKTIAVLLLVVIILGALKNGWEQVVTYAWEVGIAIISLNVGAMMLGAFLARQLGLSARQLIAITMEVGVQNTTLAFGIAMTLLGDFLIAVPAIIYALLVYITAGIVVFIGRMTVGRNEATSLSNSGAQLEI